VVNKLVSIHTQDDLGWLRGYDLVVHTARRTSFFFRLFNRHDMDGLVHGLHGGSLLVSMDLPQQPLGQKKPGRGLHEPILVPHASNNGPYIELGYPYSSN
jgi:hypothetical protein